VYYLCDGLEYVQPKRKGALNPKTGESYPSVNEGVYNPRTGEYYPPTNGGYFNPRTGEFYPSQDGGSKWSGAWRAAGVLVRDRLEECGRIRVIAVIDVLPLIPPSIDYLAFLVYMYYWIYELPFHSS